MKIEIDEATIENLIKYAEEHPEKIIELAEKAIDVLLIPRVQRKLATFYRSVNREINYMYKLDVDFKKKR